MLEVKIKSSCSVKPSESTPNATLYLSECDQIKQYTHAPIIYIFPSHQVTNSSVSNPFETLKTSLSRLLVSYYPLAGRLNWIEGGRFELHCNDNGAEMIEAETDAVLEELGDFRPTVDTRKLVPSVDYTKDISELPLFLAQLTKFKCGGLCVGTAISHIVVDGKGALEFVSSWTNLARGGKNLTVEPFHDRTVFYRGNPWAKPKFDHTELKASPELLEQHNLTDNQLKESRVTMLKISKDQVENLKKKANEGRSKDDTSREFSRFEALAAHIWRCVSRARKLRNEQQTSLRIAADFRNRIRPALPPGYYGNAVMVTSPVAEVGELLSGLGQACHKIRCYRKLDDDYVKSAIDFLVSQKDLSRFRTGFHSPDIATAINLGNPNVVITSWIGLPTHDADFGWGEPIFMGPAALGFEGKSFIIPAIHEQGSFLVPIRLHVAYIDDFEKFFYEDCTSQN